MATRDEMVDALVAGADEGGDQFGDAAVEHGPLLAAGLVGERAGDEGLSRTGRPADDQVERLSDLLSWSGSYRVTLMSPSGSERQSHRGSPFGVIQDGQT